MNKTVLITGASSGIGYEFAHVFAEQGHDLVVVARRKSKLDKLAAELEKNYQVKVVVEVRDLGQEEECQALYDSMKAQGIEVEYLINNAGLGAFGRFDQVEWSKQKQMIDVNISALTCLAHLFSKDMVERKTGSIINVASTASFQPGPHFAVYCATKAYVLSLSEAMAEEFKDLGISVLALCPGLTESGFFEVAEVADSKALKKFTIPTSREVAEYGYLAMKKKRRVAIHGTLNWITANSSRFMPRSVVALVSGKLLKQV